MGRRAAGEDVDCLDTSVLSGLVTLNQFGARPQPSPALLTPGPHYGAQYTALLLSQLTTPRWILATAVTVRHHPPRGQHPATQRHGTGWERGYK